MKLNIVKLGFVALAFFAVSNVSAQKKQKVTPEEKFSQLDVDNDGGITLEEFINKERKKEVSEEKLAEKFAKLDADANGSLTLEEFAVKGKKKKKKKKKSKKEA